MTLTNVIVSSNAVTETGQFDEGEGGNRLQRLVDDYPRAPLVEAANAAAHYGLYDLERLERMVLRHIAKDYFLVPRRRRDDPEEPDDG